MEGWEEPPFTHADNEEFLHLLREGIVKLGMEDEKTEVRFEKLTVEAEVRAGRRDLPTLINTCLNAFQEVLGALHLGKTKKKHIKILNEVEGIIRPSRMTLILGPPGSGKTTFLKALSGKLDSNLKLKGRIMYNGQLLNRHLANCLSSYVTQYDLHHPEMTVRETLDFSGCMFGTNHTIGGESPTDSASKRNCKYVDKRLKFTEDLHA